MSKSTLNKAKSISTSSMDVVYVALLATSFDFNYRLISVFMWWISICSVDFVWKMDFDFNFNVTFNT